MTNMLDYLAWRGDLPFSASPFCEIDNIILAMLSFIDFSGIVPPSPIAYPVTLAECLENSKERFPDGQYFGSIIPKDNNDLLEKTASSERFRDTYVIAFRDEIDEDNVKQFAAVTFILPDNSLYVAFRGTDDTLVGWREDFAMSYDAPTTSQKCAAEYVADVAAAHSGAIRIGGHSKGGNLAMYSAAFVPAEVQARIITVYNNDGPGFMPEILDTDGFRAVADRIYTVVPQSSAVGILLTQVGEPHVIESTESNGVKQHNPYSWVVSGTKFRHLDSLSKQGKRHNDVLDEWIMGFTAEERRKMTDTIFSVLEASGAKTLTDITDSKLTSAAAMIKALVGLDKETRENAALFIKRLSEALKNEK